MASSVISNPVANSDRSRDLKRKKKKIKSQIKDQHNNHSNGNNRARWKSETEQQIYSSKLLQALRQVRLSPSPSAPRRGRAVREAADQALAVAAKGRTLWSRAILTNRIKLKFMKHKRPRAPAPRNLPSRKPKVSILRFKGKNLPAVQRKARVLGRLVPGCRKEPLPVILEEATDYIAALEMQIRAMSALAELLSDSGSGAGPSTPTC
ncbi:transcription factor bHLH148 [Malania oleifera]|uniref:transcription factor bHLH148 n=1 Tax=Malania oleifera TaxID=397392 RepID=UPI0025AE96E6|nr:transcription factor bHLH148 [Malania oleifera]XP_057957333.1 transcription factor bHLH148 [Malania oleifera]